MFDHISRYHGLARLTHKINHSTWEIQTEGSKTGKRRSEARKCEDMWNCTLFFWLTLYAKPQRSQQVTQQACLADIWLFCKQAAKRPDSHGREEEREFICQSSSHLLFSTRRFSPQEVNSPTPRCCQVALSAVRISVRFHPSLEVVGGARNSGLVDDQSGCLVEVKAKDLLIRRNQWSVPGRVSRDQEAVCAEEIWGWTQIRIKHNPPLVPPRLAHSHRIDSCTTLQGLHCLWVQDASLLPQEGGMGSSQSQSPSRWWPVAIFWRNSDARVRNKSSCCCSWSQVTTDNHTLPPIRSASYLLTTLSLGQLDCQMMKPSGSIYSCPRWVVVAVIPMVITGHRSTKSVPWGLEILFAIPLCRSNPTSSCYSGLIIQPAG